MSAQPDRHIDSLARLAYATGRDPLDYAIGFTEDLICVHLTVCASRMEDSATFPGYVVEPTIAALARRIVGTLMDAGWSPPAVPEGTEREAS